MQQVAKSVCLQVYLCTSQVDQDIKGYVLNIYTWNNAYADVFQTDFG